MKFFILENLITDREQIITKEQFSLIYYCINNNDYQQYYDCDDNYCIHTCLYEDIDYETFVMWEFK
jgi:hypothetical protein